MKQKSMLLGMILFASLSANSDQIGAYGLHFNAPTINNKANVSNPSVGEIVFDTSDATFYGNTDGTTGGWMSLSGNGTSTYQILTASSTVKTPSGAPHYHSLSGNSLTLTTGKWRVWCNADFDNSGTTPNYSNQAIGIFGSNGPDANSLPSALSSVSGLTSLSADVSGLGLSSYEQGAATGSVARFTTPMHILQCASSCPIYCVTYSNQTTSSNARIKVYFNAEKIE